MPTKLKKKCIARGSNFRGLSYKNKGLNTKHIVKIYKAICRPILDYAHPLLRFARQSTKEILGVAERTTLRNMAKIRHPDNPLYNPSNTLLYERTQIEPIHDRLHQLTTNFAINKLDHILDLCHKRNNKKSKYKYPPQTLLEELQTLRELYGNDDWGELANIE